MSDADLDVALDAFAFAVGFAMMGPDGRRRLQLELADCIDRDAWKGGDVAALRNLDALATGERLPITLQDRLTLHRLDIERDRPAFDDEFWARRNTDLRNAGWQRDNAAAIVAAMGSIALRHLRS